MEIYIKLFDVLFPVFFIVGIGYYLGKKNPKIDTTFIANFAANIGSPAIVIYSFNSTNISFEIFKDYFWYYLIAMIGFFLVGSLFLFFLKIDRQLFTLISLVLCEIITIVAFLFFLSGV